MFCRNCGQKIEDDAKFCPICGAKQEEEGFSAPDRKESCRSVYDSSSDGYAFLCFLFPIIGLLLFLVWKDMYPLRARSCGKGAIAGVITAIVVSILWSLIVFLARGFKT